MDGYLNISSDEEDDLDFLNEITNDPANDQENNFEHVIPAQPNVENENNAVELLNTTQLEPFTEEFYYDIAMLEENISKHCVDDPTAQSCAELFNLFVKHYFKIEYFFINENTVSEIWMKQTPRNQTHEYADLIELDVIEHLDSLLIELKRKLNGPSPFFDFNFDSDTD